MNPAGPPPYGPQSHQVRQFLVRLAAMGTAQRDEVVTTYGRISQSTAWARAEIELAQVIASSGRADVQRALAGPLLQLVGIHQGDDSNEFEPIAEPALAAILAIVAFDLLADLHFRILYEPFAGLISLEDLRLQVN